MRFVIKICGITNEEDARSAVEAGANAIGFNFYSKSPRAIDYRKAHAIALLLPAGVDKVGVFVAPSDEELRQAIEAVPLDVVQIYGKRTPVLSHRVWRALPAGSPPEPLPVEAIVLDAATPLHGGSGLTFDWQLAAGFSQPVILAGGLDAANVAEAIEIARPQGVDACSHLERAPGIKDPTKVRAFIHAALSMKMSCNEA
jgi:phosphoribosylanthranilate isomerase